jgi:hypothetical protein
MNVLLGKLVIPIVIFVFGAVGGMFLQQKVFAPRPEKFDYSQVRAIIATEIKNIAPPTVSVQPFDADQLRRVKEFNYSPQFSGSVNVVGVDSSLVQKYIDEAVMAAFEKHIVSTDKKRRR